MKTIEELPETERETVQKCAQEMLDIQAAVDTNDGELSDEFLNSYLSALGTLYKHEVMDTLAPAVPLLLRLKGKPYSLHNYFMMEPLFSLTMPKESVWKCGRQVSKSTSLAAQGNIQSAAIPYFSSLYVCPRFEQTRRFSGNYVKPFLTESPLGQLMVSSSFDQSVLQRSFVNHSVQHFSYAFLDCERIRGISSDLNRYDEVQDLDWDFIPIINETLSASQFAVRQYSGTPKTFDNTLQGLWDLSSQAEWVTRCSCKPYWNVATVEMDLIKMIQEQGPSCANCGKLLDIPSGQWQHRYPERRALFEGHHVPQVIMPLHYLPNPMTGDKDKWLELYRSMDTMEKSKLYNEKFGESCDTNVTLITRSDMQKASILPWQNTIDSARNAYRGHRRYATVCMGVDWGGGGERGISYTSISIVGVLPSGSCDLIYGERFTRVYDPLDEIDLIIRYFNSFGCDYLAHDFGGAGSLRETLLIQAKFPVSRLFPALYLGTSRQGLVKYKQNKHPNDRSYYQIDKARSLVLLCQLIKHGELRFPEFHTWEELSNDFLALYEDRTESARGADIYLVRKKPTKTDDFVHSTNLACLCAWHTTARYPNLAHSVGIRITSDQIEESHPENPDWSDV
jgi:hypothetical protein